MWAEIVVAICRPDVTRITESSRSERRFSANNHGSAANWRVSRCCSSVRYFFPNMKIVALPLNMKTADIEYDRTNGIIPRFAELYGSRISQGRKLRCWTAKSEPTGNQTKLLDCYLCAPSLAGKSHFETYSCLVKPLNRCLRRQSKAQNFCHWRSVVPRKPAQSRVHRTYSE